MQGVVTKSTGSWYIVKTDDGQVLDCRIRGKFRLKGIKSTNPVVVGDRVALVKEEESYLINELFERKNYIIRKSVNLSKQTHIIASNIDQAVLMVTIKSPVTTTGFIDRFLVSAKAYGIEAVLLFNKVDLYDQSANQALNNYLSIYRSAGYTCITTSVLHDELSQIKAVMSRKTNVICGHSGVGKSTLLNALQPSLEITTNKISQMYQQGQHTTTFSQLYELDFGATVIDTPGVKGFGLVEIERDELADYFPEFFDLKSDCKFNNCLHINEPHCAVKKALDEGLISSSRYQNYLSMLHQDEENFRVNKYQ